MEYATFRIQDSSFLATEKRRVHNHVDVGHVERNSPAEALPGLDPAVYCLKSELGCCCECSLDTTARNSQRFIASH